MICSNCKSTDTCWRVMRFGIYAEDGITQEQLDAAHAHEALKSGTNSYKCCKTCGFAERDKRIRYKGNEDDNRQKIR